MRSKFLVPMIILAALPACSASRPPWADGAMVRTEAPENAGGQDLSNLQGRLLALHNRERSALGIPPLAWDAGLAASAAAYGPELERLGRLSHSPRESRAGQGENLWMGTSGAFSPEEMVGGWAGEKSLFRAGTFPDVATNGHWADVAHYTQMIWRGSTRAGCALHRASRYDFLICRYSPAGNVTGQTVP